VVHNHNVVITGWHLVDQPQSYRQDRVTVLDKDVASITKLAQLGLDQQEAVCNSVACGRAGVKLMDGSAQPACADWHSLRG